MDEHTDPDTLTPAQKGLVLLFINCLEADTHIALERITDFQGALQRREIVERAGVRTDENFHQSYDLNVTGEKGESLRAIFEL